MLEIIFYWFIVAFSRLFKVWEYGIEVYHFLIIVITLQYGFAVALLVNITSFMPAYLALKTPKLLINCHHVNGLLNQSSSLLLISILAVILKSFILANPVTYCLLIIVLSDYTIGNYVRFRVTPILPFRIVLYTLVGLAWNYLIITKFNYLLA